MRSCTDVSSHEGFSFKHGVKKSSFKNGVSEHDTEGRRRKMQLVGNANAHHHKLLKSNSTAQFTKSWQAFAIDTSEEIVANLCEQTFVQGDCFLDGEVATNIRHALKT